jgi:hypothetical protein
MMHGRAQQALYNLVLKACARTDQPDLELVHSFVDAMRDADISLNTDTYDALMETYLKNQLFAQVRTRLHLSTRLACAWCVQARDAQLTGGMPWRCLTALGPP